jgi:hypothetical protein
LPGAGLWSAAGSRPLCGFVAGLLFRVGFLLIGGLSPISQSAPAKATGEPFVLERAKHRGKAHFYRQLLGRIVLAGWISITSVKIFQMQGYPQDSDITYINCVFVSDSYRAVF